MNLREFSVASFNLYNLNEPGMPLYNQDGWDRDAYGMKIAWTAHLLRLLRSEVFGFQELWHAQSLRNALEAAGLAGDYDVLAPDGADGSGIVCAAIVAKGLLHGKPRWISDFPEGFVLRASGDDPQTPAIEVGIGGFSRPVLHFVIQPREKSPRIHVYVCHLKSKVPAPLYREAWFNADRDAYARHAGNIGAALSTIRRTAEAAALRFLLTERMKGSDTPVIVLGDLNDGEYSNTLGILTEQPTYLAGGALGGRDNALYAAQTLQEYRDTRDVYYTHVYQGMRESLDHILVSEQFYDNSRKRQWLFQGMTVNNDHLNFDDHKTSGTNDHGIIRAVFRYRPMSRK